MATEMPTILPSMATLVAGVGGAVGGAGRSDVQATRSARPAPPESEEKVAAQPRNLKEMNDE